MAQYDKEHCCLCLEEFSDRPTQQVLSKGHNNLIRICEEQEKTDLTVYLKNLKYSDEVLYVQTLGASQQMSVPPKKVTFVHECCI